MKKFAWVAVCLCLGLEKVAAQQELPYRDSLEARLPMVRDSERAEVLLRLVRIASSTHDSLKIAFYVGWMGRLADSLNNPYLKVLAMYHSTYLLSQGNDEAKERTYLDQTLQVMDSLHYKRGLALVYGRLGNIYMYGGRRYKEAIGYYQRALQLDTLLKAYDLASQDLCSIGESYEDWGEVDSSKLPLGLRYLHQALQMAHKGGDKLTSVSVEITLGATYYHLRQYKAAEDTLRIALQQAYFQKSKRSVVESLAWLSRVLVRRKAYTEARDSAQKAIVLGKTSGGAFSYAYLALAEAEYGLGFYAEGYRNQEIYRVMLEKGGRNQTSNALASVEVDLKQAKDEAQLSNLKRQQAEQRAQYNLLLAGVALFLGLGGVILWAYRHQRRAYRLLRAQHKEIQQKNNDILERNEEIRRISEVHRDQNEQLVHANKALGHANDALGQKSEEIQTQHEQLSDAYFQIQESIHYARRIQDAILPPEAALAQAFPEHFIFYQPRDIVSGDFYFFAERGGYRFLAVVDCTGHGIPGAFMSLIGESLLSQIIIDKKLSSPEQILAELHIAIRKALKQESSDSRDGMDIALIVLQPDGKTLHYAGAQSPLYCVSKAGTVIEFKADKYSIGGWQPEARRHFTLQTLQLGSPSMLYLCSDGFKHQFGGPNKRKFGSKRLSELFQHIAPLPMSLQRCALVDAFQCWRGIHRQLDDLLVLGLRLAPEHGPSKSEPWLAAGLGHELSA